MTDTNQPGETMNRTAALAADARPLALNLIERGAKLNDAAVFAGLFAVWMSENAAGITRDNIDEALVAFRIYCEDADAKGAFAA